MCGKRQRISERDIGGGEEEEGEGRVGSCGLRKRGKSTEKVLGRKVLAQI